MKLVSPRGLALAIIVLLSAAHGLAQEAAAASEQRQTAIGLEQQGRNAEAEAAWRNYLKIQPTAEAYAHLGFLEARQEHYRGAIPLYQKAMALDPAIPGLKMNLGLALFKGGELKPATEIFNALRRD